MLNACYFKYSQYIEWIFKIKVKSFFSHWIRPTSFIKILPKIKCFSYLYICLEIDTNGLHLPNIFDKINDLSFSIDYKHPYIYIQKKMLYDWQWDNCPQEINITHTLTTIGHRTAFINEQSSYRIVSYKRPRYDNVKHFKRETNSLIYIKKWTKNKYVTHKQTTTTDLQSPDLGQAQT